MTVQPRANLLTRFPLLKHILRSRLFQPAMMLVTLTVFVLAIFTGLFGTPAGSRNFGIIFVWIVWWALLIIGLVPFLGRAWCAVCPIPAPGEWLQRRSIIGQSAGKLHTLRRRWPRRMKNIWLQNAGFMAVAVFSAVILTRPAISAWVLLAFLLSGIVLSVLFEKRTFCRYVCPVGGFIGLYAMVSPLELRVADPDLCAQHTPKDCITGNARGYGCPWLVYPGSLTRNTYCGLCMECLKTCPHDNIVIRTRRPGSDLFVIDERRLDEAYKAFIMLGCALVYSAVLLGPWGWLKGWANMQSLPHSLLYMAGFLLIVLVLLPGLFALVVMAANRLSGSRLSLRQQVIHTAYALVPLGLAAWIAFSLGFVLTNASYALPVISDPFGWGWDLFGTTGVSWTPLLPGITPVLQTGVLIAGLFFSTRATSQIARSNLGNGQAAQRFTLPVAVYLLGITLGFLRLYLG